MMAQTGERTLWINNFHYQNAHKLKVGMEVELELEPDNPHDPNAIAVFARLGLIFKSRVQVGYIPKGTAKRMQGKPLPQATVTAIRVTTPEVGDDEEECGSWKFQINLRTT